MMSSALDMSLDDIISNNRKSRSSAYRGRGRGRGFGLGPVRRFLNRTATRTTPYTTVTAPETTWKHDMFMDQALWYQQPADRPSAIETGTKLYISNLDYGVSNEDIKELFSEVGDLKRFSINYDRSGRSKGTAEVVFSRKVDAIEAVKKYNNVQLDGKPMNIEIVGTNLATTASLPPSDVVFGSLSAFPIRRQGLSPWLRAGAGSGGFNGSRGSTRVRARGGFRANGAGQVERVSIEDLDADLDKYHSEAMQMS